MSDPVCQSRYQGFVCTRPLNHPENEPWPSNRRGCSDGRTWWETPKSIEGESE
jgi:hypothetical protein